MKSKKNRYVFIIFISILSVSIALYVVTEVETLKDSLKSRIASQQSKIDSLEKDWRILLSSKIDSQQSKIDSLKRNWRILLSSKIDSLSESIDTWQSKIDSLSESIDNVKKIIKFAMSIDKPSMGEVIFGDYLGGSELYQKQKRWEGERYRLIKDRQALEEQRLSAPKQKPLELLQAEGVLDDLQAGQKPLALLQAEGVLDDLQAEITKVNVIFGIFIFLFCLTVAMVTRKTFSRKSR